VQRRSRIAVIVAIVVSIPQVAVALIAAVYIAHSLLAEPWYRNLFWAYGSKQMVLYVVFAFGVAAAAGISLRSQRPWRGAARFALIAASIAGAIAAALLEIVFWVDDDPLLPPGLLLLPFVAWAIVAAMTRRVVPFAQAPDD
jgi:hypothetical protein